MVVPVQQRYRLNEQEGRDDGPAAYSLHDADGCALVQKNVQLKPATLEG